MHNITESLNSYFADNACPDCDAGQVELRIGSEVVETITCSTCNGAGWLVPSELAKVTECHKAFNLELSRVKL